MSTDPAAEAAQPSSLRRVGRLLGLVGGSAAVCGVLAVAVFPTSTYLDQRSDTAEVEERLAVLRSQNAAYEDRIERLQTVEEIQRLAREQYNLVFPGEEAYAVLPAPLPELDLPAVWPFGEMLRPDPAVLPKRAVVRDVDPSVVPVLPLLAHPSPRG